MEVLHPELRKVVSDLDLTQESRDLLLATLIGEGKTIAPNDALGLLWLLGSLRSDGILGLIPLQKTHSLENLITLIRHGHEEWVSRVCYILYEGDLPPQRTSSFLPEGTIRDLLRWVNAEKSEKVRESLWAILLRKDVGLAIVAKIPDVAIGLCEKDPITRNNVIRFLFDHFTPEEVVESLFQYSMASGKRVPGVAFKRYVSLLKEQEGPQQKKYILERILSTAQLDDTEIAQIFSDYMNSLNRFDLIRLLSLSAGSPPRIADLRRKDTQMGFLFDHRKITSPHDGSFRQRICLLKQV
jgi:hypothetical protein